MQDVSLCCLKFQGEWKSGNGKHVFSAVPRNSQCLHHRVLAAVKCYCQRKPGRSKTSRSAIYLHLFTVQKLSEKISNGGICSSRRSFFFKIWLYHNFGPSSGLKKHKFLQLWVSLQNTSYDSSNFLYFFYDTYSLIYWLRWIKLPEL